MKEIWKLAAAVMFVLAAMLPCVCAETQKFSYDGYAMLFEAGDGVKVEGPFEEYVPSLDADTWRVNIGEDITGYPALKGPEASLIIFDFNGRIDTEFANLESYVRQLLNYDGMSPDVTSVSTVNGTTVGVAHFSAINLSSYVIASPIRGSGVPGDKIVTFGCWNNPELFNRVANSFKITSSG